MSLWHQDKDYGFHFGRFGHDMLCPYGRHPAFVGAAHVQPARMKTAESPLRPSKVHTCGRKQSLHAMGNEIFSHQKKHLPMRCCAA